MDEAGRTTQPPLIMAPPSLKAAPDGEAEDTIVDNGIMSPSRKSTGSSRSGAPQRAEDADGDSYSSSDEAATVTPTATADEDTAEAGSSAPVPLPAETVGQGKVRSTGLADSAEGNRRGSEWQERQGSRQAMTSADSTWLADKTTTEPADAAVSAAPAASGTPAAKSDREPSFSPSAGSASAVSAAAASAATTSTPAAPASSSAEAGSSYSRPGSYTGPSYTATSYSPPSSYSRPDWSTSEDSAAPVPAPAASARAGGAGTASSPGDGYSPGNRSSSGAEAAAGLASSVNSAWQKQRSSARNVQARKSTKRQAMLTLARVEPWSVMKFSFVASVVAFIILFVAVAVLYMVLSALGVFDSLQHTVSSITSSQSDTGTNISHWFSASLILGYTAMLGALNIVLITAMSTVGSVIYNLIAKTIGGIEVTLRETD